MNNKDIDYLVNFLEDKQIPVITKDYHTYLTFHGLKAASVFILKEGVIKTSVILQDGREFAAFDHEWQVRSIGELFKRSGPEIWTRIRRRIKDLD